MPLPMSRSFAVARQHTTTGADSYFAQISPLMRWLLPADEAGSPDGMESINIVGRGDMDAAPGDTLLALDL
jgi:hypothetical protein